MATFEALIVRAVALELQRRVRDVYLELLPLYSTVQGWTLNNTDPRLPAPFDVKVPLAGYKALTLTRLKLDEWGTALLTAAPGDTLTYPIPPADTTGGLLTFDESVQYSENLIF